jgi:hypothetical protein
MTKGVDKWSINEAEVVLSLIEGSQMDTLMIGSQAIYKDTQLCVVLGFTKEISDSDIKGLKKDSINYFKTTVYCED